MKMPSNPGFTAFISLEHLHLIRIKWTKTDSIKAIKRKSLSPKSMEKIGISNIHFKSGRTEEFVPDFNIVTLKSYLNWQSVQLSKLNMSRGGYKITRVGAKAKGMSTCSSISKLQNSAFNKDKIEAAMLEVM